MKHDLKTPRREIETAISDDLKKYVTPIISSDGINHFITCSMKHFEEVARYMWGNFNIDFEILTSIDYSLVVSDANFSKLISMVSSNDNRYEDKELLYLSLRSMMTNIWKLDVLFLTHLNYCAEVNMKWNMVLRYLVQNNLGGNYYCMSGMPYWLRNEHITLLNSPPPQYSIDELHGIELAMLKSNDIQAYCGSLGDKHMIFLDHGLYCFLSEWCRLILSGYRLRKYCEESEFDLTEPVKIGSSLIIAIADILANKEKVYFMPPMIMLFNRKDPVIIKEIVTYQIDFILAHEYGHIMLKHHSENLENENSADIFALNWMKRLKVQTSIINKNENKKLDIEQNDIQSVQDIDRRIESIEILFAFYDLFYYVNRKRKYKLPFDGTHPQIAERRSKAQELYVEKGGTPLIKYIDELSLHMRNYIDSILK